MTFDQYGKQTVGGTADVPEECRAKEDAGSPDDKYCRVKAPERSIPEEASGFQDARPLGGDPYYGGYGGG